MRGRTGRPCAIRSAWFPEPNLPKGLPGGRSASETPSAGERSDRTARRMRLDPCPARYFSAIRRHSSSEGTRSFRPAGLNVTVRAVRGAAFPSVSPDGIPARAMTLLRDETLTGSSRIQYRVIQKAAARVSYPVLARPGAEPSNRGGGFAKRREPRIQEAGGRGRRKRDIGPFGSVAAVEAPSCHSV